LRLFADENLGEPTCYAETFDQFTKSMLRIGMNQLRRLVSKIVQVHGETYKIVVELTLDWRQGASNKFTPCLIPATLE